MAISSRSAQKRVRTSEKAKLRNKSRTTAIKSVEKKLRTAAEASEPKTTELLAATFSKLDKACKDGTIHKNKADRKKSRLAKLLATTKKDSPAT